jgi:hypothetical protein
VFMRSLYLAQTRTAVGAPQLWVKPELPLGGGSWVESWNELCEKYEASAFLIR